MLDYVESCPSVNRTGLIYLTDQGFYMLAQAAKKQQEKHFMNKELQIVEVNDFDSFKKLRAGWDALIEKSPTQDVFLTWEWFYAWFKSYGKDSHPHILTAWKNNELVGVAPFMLINQKKYGMNFRVLRTLSAPQCDIGGFLIKDGDPEIVASILDHLSTKRGEWDLLEFNQFLLEGMETKSIIGKFSKLGFTSLQISNYHYYIPLDNNSWDTYLSGLSRNFRKQLKRSQKNIEKEGTFAIQRYSGREVTWDVIQTVIDINRHSTYPLICQSEEDQTLHRELIEVMADKGWFDLFLFILNGEPIAYEYGFLYRGRTEGWRVGFDRRTNPSLSTGVFMTMNVLQTCFNEGQMEVDFLRGDEGYKNSWKPAFREYTHIKTTCKRKIITALAFIWLPRIKSAFQNLTNRSVQTEENE